MNKDKGAEVKHYSQFYLAITNRCNLSCIMCSTTRHAHEVERELDLREWLVILEHITSLDVDVISFGGGEPFLRSGDLLEMIKFIGAKRIKINIVTNGTLIGKSFLEEIEDLREYCVFVVSCDGLEPENDHIRGSGTFKKIFESVDLLRSKGFVLYLTSVLMPENFAHFIDYLEFINAEYPDIGIDIQPVIPHNEIYYKRRSFNLTEEQLSRLERIIDFLRLKNMVMLCRPLKLIEQYLNYFSGTLESKNQCKMGTASFNINLRGNIWICGKELEYPLHKYKLGEVLNSKEYITEMQRVRSCKSPCLAGLVI